MPNLICSLRLCESEDSGQLHIAGRLARDGERWRLEGPDDVADRAFCSGVAVVEYGYSLLVSANIDEVVLADTTDPLIYFRGNYRGLQ